MSVPSAMYSHALAADSIMPAPFWNFQDSNEIFEVEFAMSSNSQGSLSPTGSQISSSTEACHLSDCSSMDQTAFSQFCQDTIYNSEFSCNDDTILNAKERSQSCIDQQHDHTVCNHNKKKGRPLVGSSQNISPKVVRRREQNRVAQRAYRARKDDQISRMELRLTKLSFQVERLYQENQTLLEEIKRLNYEKGGLTTF